MERIDESWTRELAQKPETGMGYQVLELRFPGARAGSALIVNGQFHADVPWKRKAVLEADENIERRVGERLRGRVTEADYTVLGPRHAKTRELLETAAATTGEGPASAAPIEQSDPGERFMRFSAFANDFRILADGSVTPGTYVTTRDDGLQVQTGTQAVSRYALPNKDPAKHRYHLKPPTRIDVKRGTVQQANGELGGGVEVIFEHGSPSGTFERQDEIPE